MNLNGNVAGGFVDPQTHFPRMPPKRLAKLFERCWNFNADYEAMLGRYAQAGWTGANWFAEWYEADWATLRTYWDEPDDWGSRNPRGVWIGYYEGLRPALPILARLFDKIGAGEGIEDWFHDDAISYTGNPGSAWEPGYMRGVAMWVVIGMHQLLMMQELARVFCLPEATRRGTN